MRSIRNANRLAASLQYAACGIMFFIVAVPLYMAVMGGFKSLGQLQTNPAGIPAPFLTDQYTGLLTGRIGGFWRQLANSLIIGFGTVAMLLVVGTFAAYALARIKFKLNSLIFHFFQLGLLFPLAVAILPLYIQLRTFGLLDKYVGVILPQVAFQLSMQLMLLRGFIKAIPDELEEAAAIDGYGRFGFLFKIIVPLSGPILATSGVLTLVASWNNFFTPLLVFNSQKRFTLPMGVMEFMGQHASDWNMILAFLSLAMVPAVVLYVFSQKYIVAGLTGGAIKG
jgi:raffinose/stachyose/melibiose transport system permease protein